MARAPNPHAHARPLRRTVARAGLWLVAGAVLSQTTAFALSIFSVTHLPREQRGADRWHEFREQSGTWWYTSGTDSLVHSRALRCDAPSFRQLIPQAEGVPGRPIERGLWARLLEQAKASGLQPGPACRASDEQLALVESPPPTHWHLIRGDQPPELDLERALILNEDDAIRLIRQAAPDPPPWLDWAGIEPYPNPTQRKRVHLTIRAWGFPARCTYGYEREVFTPPPAINVSDADLFTVVSHSGTRSSRTTHGLLDLGFNVGPTRRTTAAVLPIPRGVLLNTLFFALALRLVFTAERLVSRALPARTRLPNLHA